MRAAVCTRYEPPEVLQLQDIEKPVPKRDEVLIKIRATTVSSSDCFVRSAIRFAPVAIQIMMRLVPGIAGPRNPILGLVLAGEIEETGKAVTRFRSGDRVCAFTKFHFGCYAEYTCLRETSAIASAPSNLTYEEAAAIPYGGPPRLIFPQERQHSEWATGSHRRSIRRGGELCRSARQALWGGGHSGVRQHKPRVGEVFGSRHGD